MNRRIIGVLTAELSDSYQAKVWEGITAEASRGDEGVVCFLGSRIDSPDAQETAANAVYEMATTENISGLIVVASAISTYSGRERLQRLFDSRGNLPMVSIGVPVEGAGSVSVDSREALEELVDHIVVDHGRSAIALIAGPRWHVESEQRRETVERRLAHHGIVPERHSIFHGDFEPESGRAAVSAFFESPDRPDAVLSMNDRMALGALKELRRRGFRVPEDVSLTGFDGIEETIYSSPPLTTVLQPLEELGGEAIRELRMMMDRGKSRDIVLGCRTLRRRSCGCVQEGDAGNADGLPTSREQAARRLAERERSRTLRNVGFALSETFETKTLIVRLREGLSRIGIGDGFLVLFGGNADSRERTLLDLSEAPAMVLPGEKTVVPESKILPDGLLSTRSRRIWILVPLVFLDHALGYLILSADSPDGEVYEILAMQLASSLRGAQLLERVRGHERSLEEEVVRRTRQISETNRKLRMEIDNRIRLEAEVAEISRRTMERIGQDLHDDLCQYLAGIAMHASVLEGRLSGGDDELKDGIATISRLLADSIDRTKAIARGLLPVGLKDEGLPVALKALANATRTSTGIPVAVDAAPGWSGIDPNRSLEVYRIIQEALHNSIRHSGCDSVEIRLSVSKGPGGDEDYIAEVIDDGNGIPENELPKGGMGMKIMEYRAEKTGAELEIESGSAGTVVKCVIRNGGEKR